MPDPRTVHGVPITFSAMIREAEREVAMRRKVYGAKGMDRTMEIQLATMDEIASFLPRAKDMAAENARLRDALRQIKDEDAHHPDAQAMARIARDALGDAP